MATPNSGIEISTIQDCDPDTTYAPKNTPKTLKKSSGPEKMSKPSRLISKVILCRILSDELSCKCVKLIIVVTDIFEKKKSGNHLIFGQRNSHSDPGFGRLMLFQVLSRSNQRDLSDTPVHILIFMI